MSLDAEAVNASLRRLTTHEVARGEDDLLAALSEVVTACVDIFGVTGSGVMLADETSEIHYVAASDGQGRLLEKAESQTGQGPCTDAFVQDRVVWTDDVRADARWPDFRAVVGGQPELRAVMGVPVKLGSVRVGTLDVFLDRPHAWTEAERDALSRYSTVVQATLTAALAAHSAGEQAAQLQYALDYRVVIERGVGFLMAREHLDAAAAFERLRQASRSSRTKIGLVAQYLLDTGRLPPREP
ncbi:GAF and ANTAR domain-containing protein [Nocardioides marmoraquaticus]